MIKNLKWKKGFLRIWFSLSIIWFLIVLLLIFNDGYFRLGEALYLILFAVVLPVIFLPIIFSLVVIFFKWFIKWIMDGFK